MHGPHAGVLLELQSSQRAVGRPNLRLALVHSIERLLADSSGRLESLRRHRICAVVPAAFHDSGRCNTRDLAEQVAAFETDGLGTKMTRSVICDLFARSAAESLVESRFVTNRPQEFARIDNCGS